MGRLYEETLRLGAPRTFNVIWELQQLASALAYSQVKEPKVFVDPDHKWISIGGEALHLESLQRGMRYLIEKVKEMYVSLSGDEAWPVPTNHHVVDDIDNVSMGYCFLDESPFKENKHAFLVSAVERYNMVTLGGDGVWAWDRNAVRSFLERSDRIWGHAIHALYVGSQLSTRVTQFLQHQIRNADRPRNLIFQGQEALLIGRYSKTTNLKGRDACVPAFLSTPLRELLLVLLSSGFREAQAILAGIEYGEEARRLYRM